MLPSGRVLLVLAAAAVATFAATTALPVEAVPAWKQAPTGLSVSPGDNPGELAISWDAHPADPIEYRVAWAPSDEGFKSFRDADWNAFPTSTSITVTGLDPGGSYKAKVRARVTRNRNSAWSEVATGAARSATEPTTAVGKQIAPNPDAKGAGGVSDEEGRIGTRVHQDGVPWTGHTVHAMQAKNTHQITSSNSPGDQVWYRVNLQANRMYRFWQRDASGREKSGFSEQSTLARAFLRVYDSAGNPHVEEGHAVHAWRLRIDGTNRYQTPYFYFMPDTGGDYYLRVTSDADDTGVFTLEFATAWSSAKGNRYDSNACKYILGNAFSRRNCRVVPGSTLAAMKFHENVADGGDTDASFDYVHANLVYIPMEKGVSYEVCIEPDRHSSRTVNWMIGTQTDPNNLTMGFTHNVGSGSGSLQKCQVFTPQRTLPYAFKIRNVATVGLVKRTTVLDYDVSYSEQ